MRNMVVSTVLLLLTGCGGCVKENPNTQPKLELLPQGSIVRQQFDDNNIEIQLGSGVYLATWEYASGRKWHWHLTPTRAEDRR